MQLADLAHRLASSLAVMELNLAVLRDAGVDAESLADMRAAIENGKAVVDEMNAAARRA